MLQHLKTSTILLLTAGFILLGSLVGYNMALQSEFNKGTYKDPYRNYVTLNHRDFNQVIINPATEINVKIVSGDYKVQVHEFANDFIQIKKSGSNLQVDLVYPQQEKRKPYGDLVVITCPNLANLKTNGFYSVQGKKITSTKSWDDNTVTVQGFQQPALGLQQDKATAVRLSNNKLNRLEAVVGVSTGSSARLNLE